MPILSEPLPDHMAALIRRAVERETELIVAQEAVEAGRRVERRVREKTAQICATVLQRMDMQYRGNQLCITVNFEKIHA